ncbi:MAG: M48 family metalloprotease [Rhodocyclaceae bacterium]|nr:M48 family metalloprotease [Rhodocyclaceae bacterium]
MNAVTWHRHAAANRLQSTVLLIAMLAIAGLAAHLLLGPVGAVLALALACASLASDPAACAALTLRQLRARPLSRCEAPALWRILDDLALRAGLPATPVPHRVRSPVPNAFALGQVQDSAIGLTDALLAQLDRRELTAVLAHEVAHIAHDDLRMLNLTAQTARMTQWMALLGQALLLLALPSLWLDTGWHVDWLAVGLLAASPYLALWLQSGLSRTREFDADLKAVALTGDPRGLALALARIDAAQPRWLHRALGLSRLRVPDWLSSHPATRARIGRLRSLTTPASHRA